MKRYAINNLAAHCQITEPELIECYLKVIVEEPRPEDMTKTLYLTVLAIKLLECIGNRFPTQAQIDCIERHVKKYNKKKYLTAQNNSYQLVAA